MARKVSCKVMHLCVMERTGKRQVTAVLVLVALDHVADANPGVSKTYLLNSAWPPMRSKEGFAGSNLKQRKRMSSLPRNRVSPCWTLNEHG